VKEIITNYELKLTTPKILKNPRFFKKFFSGGPVPHSIVDWQNLTKA